MKALSIRQPWAWLIVNGYKHIENRSWRTNYRGRIYVHAGAEPSGRNYNETKHVLAEAQRLAPQVSDRLWELLYTRDQHPGWSNTWWGQYGHIIGEVNIIDCVEGWDTGWFTGPYGFVLANPVAYDAPIPYKGRLGFFEVTLPAARAAGGQ